MKTCLAALLLFVCHVLTAAEATAPRPRGAEREALYLLDVCPRLWLLGVTCAHICVCACLSVCLFRRDVGSAYDPDCKPGSLQEGAVRPHI